MRNALPNLQGFWLAVLFLFPAVAVAKVPVTVSVPPQAQLVEAIGGDRVDVSVMIQPGQSPHTFSLSPRQLMALDDGRIYFKVGHPDLAFEHRFLRHVEEQDRSVEIVDLSSGVELMAMEDHDHDHDHHGDGDAHDHGETDPHLWVSPAIMRRAAEPLTEALVAVDPEGEEEYRQRLEAFLDDLDALDASIRDRFQGLEQRRFVVNHPAWGYFAREYDLEQVAIESGGRDPSPAQLARFIEQAKDEGVRVVFVQQGFSERSARVIAGEIDAVVRTADPLARDWIQNLDEVAAAIHEALAP
ncbi:zinc ABC transporter solute-binding protein [Aquisalimonas sp. 2447]|uniref:metal ABC transporter solute-binding protein, Zn/Mn family n=1 Tax=Aquisalimonas sp. 2447 TaxID=2740807 RepID=UPI001432787F|nr:zinc ABC transporter substrate-binding protein [Aquisalimonas sp. 2447]QIT56433.1 zinc ABC transporter solute-binding protein [Aquisalimonas sp. 2447]